MLPFRKLAIWSLALGFLSGCATTQSDLLNDNEPLAMQAATNRAQLEITCPSLGAAVLTRKIIKPAASGPLSSDESQALYTVKVEGCDREANYEVVCSVGGQCVASLR